MGTIIETLVPIVTPTVSATISGTFSWIIAKQQYSEILRKRDQEAKAQLETQQKKAQALLDARQKELDTFKRSIEYYTYVDHTVLVDGAQASGKSAMVAKWLDPTLDIRQKQIVKTVNIADYACPLCSERYTADNGLRCEKRHRTRFIDVPGEASERLFGIIAKQRVKFVIFVIDPTDLQQSINRLSMHHVKFHYLNEIITTTCVGIAVYVSKADVATPEQIRKAITWAQTTLYKWLNMHYNDILVLSGSAVTGEGIFEIQSTIATRLDLGPHFPKHQSRQE